MHTHIGGEDVLCVIGVLAQQAQQRKRRLLSDDGTHCAIRQQRRHVARQQTRHLATAHCGRHRPVSARRSAPSSQHEVFLVVLRPDSAELLLHLCTKVAELTAANEVERKALEGLIAGCDIVADGVDDQAQKFVVLHFQTHMQISTGQQMPCICQLDC